MGPQRSSAATKKAQHSKPRKLGGATTGLASWNQERSSLAGWIPSFSRTHCQAALWISSLRNIEFDRQRAGSARPTSISGLSAAPAESTPTCRLQPAGAPTWHSATCQEVLLQLPLSHPRRDPKAELHPPPSRQSHHHSTSHASRKSTEHRSAS